MFKCHKCGYKFPELNHLSVVGEEIDICSRCHMNLLRKLFAPELNYGFFDLTNQTFKQIWREFKSGWHGK